MNVRLILSFGGENKSATLVNQAFSVRVREDLSERLVVKLVINETLSPSDSGEKFSIVKGDI